MFGILGWIVFGLVVGALAKLIMPGKDPGGIIITMLLGIVGAILGGWIGRAMGLYGPQDAARILHGTTRVDHPVSGVSRHARADPQSHNLKSIRNAL